MSMSAQPTHFQIIDNFDGQSANGAKCYITNLSRQAADPNRPQQQPHEVDEFILRGPAIDFEGYLDIRPRVITDTAREVFGMIDGAEAERLILQVKGLEAAVEMLEGREQELKSRTADMILENAELLVQITAMDEEMGQLQDELYRRSEIDG